MTSYNIPILPHPKPSEPHPMPTATLTALSPSPNVTPQTQSQTKVPNQRSLGVSENKKRQGLAGVFLGVIETFIKTIRLLLVRRRRLWLPVLHEGA